jgi:hypothetical protein
MSVTVSSTQAARIRTCAGKHPDWTLRRICNASACTMAEAHAVLGDAFETRTHAPAQSPTTATATQSAKASTSGRTLAEFRATYDRDTIIPARIRAALKSLGASWEYETEFARRAALSLGDLAAYRPQFEQYWLAIRRDGKRAWAGSPALCAQMKEMLA